MASRDGQLANREPNDGERLLAIVQTLAGELHKQRQNILATLDSRLDAELGFDSLSRVELIQRVEKDFKITLPSQLLGQAETPRDLLTALVNAGARPGKPVASPEARITALGWTQGRPLHARSLTEVLDWHLEAHADRTHVYLYAENDQADEISYAALARGSRSLAAGLQARGLSRGGRVAIMLPTGSGYLFSFFGILLAGGIPVPIYPPARLSQLEDHLRRHARILENAQASLLITVPEARNVASLLKSLTGELREIHTIESLRLPDTEFIPVPIQGKDTAFLQYTSGSTGQPKGVVLSHQDLLANIRAMEAATHADSRDVFASWLPLYHDMGLIGAWLSSLYLAMPLVLMSPLSFLAHPQRWLWTIHRHRATLSAAPNFAYELCLNKLEDSDLEGLDLSSWRLAFNGAEPVSARTLTRFIERFSACGFRPESLTPVYGLAEAAVGLAFPPLGRGPLIDRVQRDALLTTGKAETASRNDPVPLEIVACGLPLPGYQIRVVDANGRELPERREGRIEFQGPSATKGYFRNPDASAELFHGSWLRTGDRGYMAAGEIYLTSRTKDIIIRGGRNLYPYEAEAAIGDLAGIRKGCVAVFGSTDRDTGTERVVVVAESHERDAMALESLGTQIRDTAGELLGTPPDEVVIAPPHTVLKTSSGKIRRSALRELFEAGRLVQGRRGVWWQVFRLLLSSLGPAAHRLMQGCKELIFASYAHLVFWLLTPLTWLLVVGLPGRETGRRVMRQAARLLFRLLRITLRLEGQEHLREVDKAVVVCNHASYLDGVVLAAALPLTFSFIAKKELSEHPVSRLFLERIGTLFVERFDRQSSVQDANRIQLALNDTRFLLYFPEGTFGRATGLMPFRMGAFTAAAGTGTPLLPVTIRGTRSILRDESWFPRHGDLTISVAAPIYPHGSDWEAALALRDQARKVILAQLDEPDLAGS
ncbi:MAG: AMP-binding protein [Gammaproteobacteria bacterium]|nr:AMP-binding protein [Gammaproteobacteria bacterium]